MTPHKLPASALPPSSYAEILRRWEGFDVIAADCGVSYYTVAAWYRRDSIPFNRWEDVVASARRRGVVGVYYNLLRGIAAARRKQKGPPNGA